ncbi:MAG: glutathione S-transferase N-terminal domain-containing protein [Ghiorsea sp.]|nr:glutathione S-transferase N-terminal domain-containing protein [Ghiorsea sp.]
MIKLYSSGISPDSHRTRIVLAEKELPVEAFELDEDKLPDDFKKNQPLW